MDLQPTIMTSQPDGLGLVGKATARFHSYLKRHPRLRGRVISTFNAAGSLVDRIGPRDKSSLVGSVDPHRWVEHWNTDQSRPSARISNVLQAEKTVNTPPLGIHGRIDPEYLEVASVDIPRPFVAEIPGGHVLGEHGAVATPDGLIIDRASRPVGSLNAHLSGYNANDLSAVALQSEWTRRPKRTAPAAVLSSWVGRGYFHWLFDILPRLKLLEESGNDLSSIPGFVVPSYFARYQIETLARFGIERDRIISNFSHRHIVSENLIVPSHPRETGVIPRWVCDFLRDTFRPARPAGVDPIPRIYIIRKQTDHGLLDNESGLTRRLVDMGFTPLAMEDYSLEEKAWLLKHAEVVVSASGAGLANIVFCEPGTVVVELRVQPYPVMEAWDIGNRMNLRFYDVLPEDYERSQGMSAAADGMVSEEVVMSTLDEAGISI